LPIIFLFRGNFKKPSKTLEIHRCDLKAERFGPVTARVSASNTSFDLINADFSILL